MKPNAIGLVLKQHTVAGEKVITVYFRVIVRRAKEKGDEIFIPAIHAQKLFEGMTLGKEIGTCTLTVYPTIKRIEWDGFYPISRRLVGHGIGSTVQAAIVARMKRQFPGFRIKSSVITGPLRLRQLRNLGIKPSKEYPLEEYYRLTKRYLSEKFNEKRKKKARWNTVKNALKRIVRMRSTR